MAVKFQDCFGREFEMSESVWKHIKTNHPEISEQVIQDVLTSPEIIVRSSWDFFSFLYYRKTGKYYKTVVTEMREKRIKTALTADKVKQGDIIWKKT